MIMKKKSITIAAEYKRNIKCFGIIECLLNTGIYVMGIILCFNNCQRIGIKIQNVMRSFSLSARSQLSTDIDSAISKRNFFQNLRDSVPTSAFKSRRNKLSANVSF